MTETKTKLEILIVHESTAESIRNDAFSFGMLILSIGVGAFIGSSALQWIAGLIFILFLIARGVNQYKNKLTNPEARAKLDEIEAKYK